MRTFPMEERLIARKSLCGLTILLRKEHQNFNWTIDLNYWVGMSKKHKGLFLFVIGACNNALYLAIEVMPQKFLNYLSVTVISNLLFVSMYTWQFIFKKFKNIYHFSTGFASEKHWHSILGKSVYDLIEVIFNEKFFPMKLFLITISIMNRMFLPYWKNLEDICPYFQ